jgi:hypothetical protein
MVDVDAFVAWARQRGIPDADDPRFRQAAAAVAECAGDGAVLQKHVDEALRRADAARTPVTQLAILKRAGDAMIEFQRGTSAPSPIVFEERDVGGAIKEGAKHIFGSPLFWRIGAFLIGLGIFVFIISASSKHAEMHRKNIEDVRLHIIETECVRVGLEAGSQQAKDCAAAISDRCQVPPGAVQDCAANEAMARYGMRLR